jgi:pilus assembly protein FimV
MNPAKKGITMTTPTSLRHLHRLLLLLACTASQSSYALSIGETMLHSRLGEPLSASLTLSDLQGLDQQQIKVRLADRQTHQRLNADYSGFQQRINFALQSPEGDQLQVKLSTSDPVKEPYQHFIIQVVWPEGELLKDIKLLIDP